jgi:uncharacterized protein YdeI (YjbR/CyaY-like superfamily)
MTKDIETYFTSGCGRCKLFNTPECKVHTWHKELKLLRQLIFDIDILEVQMKWGMPCYTFNKKNILMLAAFKEYCSLSFFKGALLPDHEKLLVSPGENSQSVKQFKFISLDSINKHEHAIKAYVFEAIELEKKGAKIAFKNPEEYPIPEEVQARMDKDPALKEAFYTLTPGRRRAYLLHFGQAKQSATREARIEKCKPSILTGQGLNE